MLLRFGVANHRSIRDYQELILTATSLKDSEAGLIDPHEPQSQSADDALSLSVKKIRIVPVVSIYGNNAAGKSSILNALDFFVSGIINSHGGTASSEGTPFNPFRLNSAGINTPARYDADVIHDNVRYHYGYELDGKKIVTEWLYSFPLDAKRQSRTILYHRGFDEGEEFHFGKALKGDNKRIARLVRPNSLFLSVAAQNAHPQLSSLYRYFLEKVTRCKDTQMNINSLSDRLYDYFQRSPERKDAILSFLKAADIGIEDMGLERVPYPEEAQKFVSEMSDLLKRHLSYAEKVIPQKNEQTLIEFLHKGEDGKSFPIGLDAESTGTHSLLKLLGPVFTRLAEGGVLLIDELNTTLHPLTSIELIKLFSSPKTNPGRGQLIFTTHDTNFLVCGLLRRDQIWFAEKDHDGATELYPLSEIKLRRTDNIERGYLEGRFGAVPIFGITKYSAEEIGVASSLPEDE